MRKGKIIVTSISILLLVALIVAAVFPMTYGGASPMARFLRFSDGGNCAQTLLDSAAIALGKKSGIFDITKNGHDGVFIYCIDEKQNTVETYTHIGTGNNETASYILIKDGMRYSFSMDADGWKFDNSRECKTDLNRLLSNLALVLTNNEINVTELKEDLNGLTGIALEDYFDFTIVPTCIRSVIRSFEQEEFKVVSGYSFERENLTFTYRFSPANSKALADYIHSVLQIAYTSKLRNIMNIAGIAGGVADFFGYDLYAAVFEADMTFNVGAFTGKLMQLTFSTDNTDLTATLREYGNCEISINSAALEALLIKHVG